MPGSAIEPYIMSQSIPYCDRCREERAAEIAAIKAYRAQVNKNKKDWEKSDDEVDEWDGEPGIIKVGVGGVLIPARHYLLWPGAGLRV